MSDTTAGHLDLDALADTLAGEGDAAASAHLATCPSCASRLRELEAAEQRVVAVLSTLPPPTVPADLADRLAAALAAEAPLDPTVSTTGASVTALPAARDTRRRTWLPAAAAAVLLASGAGIGWSMLSGGTGSDDADTAGRELLASESGTDYADPTSLAASLPAVLAGDASATTFTDSRSSEAAGAAGTTSEDAAGSTSADAATTAEAPEAATLSAPDPLDRLRTTDGLAACLAGLQDDGAAVEPLALDYASYDGAPALAVLLPDPDPAKVAVFVVGPECAQADPHLLHYVRVDRPE